ncbi:hypothetical protein L8R81_23645, partial [Vibrio splendidus]
MVSFTKSPSVITWLTMVARAIVVIFFTPLILLSNIYLESESSSWILYLSIYNLMMLLDVGFTPTFVRHYAYSLSFKNGFEDLTTDILDRIQGRIYFLISSGGAIFVTITLIWLEIPLSLGTLVFSLSIIVVLYTGRYISCLEGTGGIYLVRVVILCQVIFQLLLLSFSIYSNSTVDSLILLYYFPCIITFFYLRYKSKIYISKFSAGNYASYEKYKSIINKQAGKSAISLIATIGMIQIMTLYYSQLETVDNSSLILYSMMLIRQFSNFSQVPFFTKIPLLSKLYATGDVELLKVKSLTYISLSVGFLCFIGVSVGLWNDYFSIGSEWHLPILSTKYWLLLVIAFMLERLVAMLQHYLSIKNVIIWHITGPLFSFFSLTIFCFCIVKGLSDYSISLP